MKRYLEITETVGINEVPDYICCEITDKTDPEIAERRKAMEDVFSGMKYTLVDHECGHDESGACIMKRLV